MEAKLLQDLGSFEAAEESYKTLISQRQSCLGHNHRDTADAMSDHGSLYVAQMRYDEALNLANQEGQITEQLLGISHYRTLETLNNRAVILFAIGDVSEAQVLLDQALFRSQLILSDNHPTAKIVLGNCGALYFELGDHEKSKTCYDEALSRLQDSLGPDHPRTLEIMIGRTCLLSSIERNYDEIDTMVQSCVEKQERVLGRYHPEALSLLQDYGSFLIDCHEWERTEKIYQSLLSRQEGHSRRDASAILNTLASLGEILDQIEHKDAQSTFRRAIKVALELDGGEGKLSRACMMNLASYLFDNSIDPEETEKLYQRIIKSKRACSDEDTIDIYSDLVNLVQVLLDLEKLEEAENTQRQLMQLRQANSNKDDSTPLGEMITLAKILFKQKQYAEAESLYLDSIIISTKASGEDDEKTLDLLANLAWTMQQEAKDEEAKMRILATLQKDKDCYRVLHPVYLRV
ncbi:hypothetical protein MMC25_002639 [Agyrium rufum]|nr:hypothetical protein [Agyrium rufum]